MIPEGDARVCSPVTRRTREAPRDILHARRDVSQIRIWGLTLNVFSIRMKTTHASRFRISDRHIYVSRFHQTLGSGSDLPGFHLKVTPQKLNR